jgi:hypothetical protein
VQSPAFFLPLRRFAAFEPLEPPSLAAQGNVAFGSKGEILTASRYFPLYPQDQTCVCTENFIRVDDAPESPKLTE